MRQAISNIRAVLNRPVEPDEPARANPNDNQLRQAPRVENVQVMNIPHAPRPVSVASVGVQPQDL